MGRGAQFLEEVDLMQVPLPSDSLLPVVEGNLIGYIGSEHAEQEEGKRLIKLKLQGFA